MKLKRKSEFSSLYIHVLTKDMDIDKLEDHIKYLDYECGFIFKPDSKLFVARVGNENRVDYKKKELIKSKGYLLTHNHPRGSTFSMSDISIFFDYDLYEIRAVSSKIKYSLRLKYINRYIKLSPEDLRITRDVYYFNRDFMEPSKLTINTLGSLSEYNTDNINEIKLINYLIEKYDIIYEELIY